MLNRLQPQYLRIVEAGLIGIFFVQALRLLIGLLYSRPASAALSGRFFVSAPVRPLNRFRRLRISSWLRFKISI